MRNYLRWSAVALVVVTMLAVCEMRAYAQASGQSQTAQQVRSKAEETLASWNIIGNRLIAMAKDFPEDKYDFKVQKDQRTFAENLLHVAAVDYDLAGMISGAKLGPDFGQNKHNPSRENYKTKADVVKLLEDAVAAGAKVIEEQGARDWTRRSSFCGNPGDTWSAFRICG
jgi:uncharacterized damage-inducible protein DinB